MYIEEYNDMVFQLGHNAIGTTTASCQWSIKVTQYSCDYSILGLTFLIYSIWAIALTYFFYAAPKGYTQYYFGNTVDQVQTYNYAGGMHLADQNQAICVRQEEGNCRICYTTTTLTDFPVAYGYTATKSTYESINFLLLAPKLKVLRE